MYRYVLHEHAAVQQTPRKFNRVYRSSQALGTLALPAKRLSSMTYYCLLLIFPRNACGSSARAKRGSDAIVSVESSMTIYHSPDQAMLQTIVS